MHVELSGFVTSNLIQNIMDHSAGQRIEMFMPRWQESVIETALNIGFTQRVEGYTMGIVLTS